MMVGTDPFEVDRQLIGSALAPGCMGELRPWGFCPLAHLADRAVRCAASPSARELFGLWAHASAAAGLGLARRADSVSVI